MRSGPCAGACLVRCRACAAGHGVPPAQCARQPWAAAAAACAWCARVRRPPALAQPRARPLARAFASSLAARRLPGRPRKGRAGPDGAAPHGQARVDAAGPAVGRGRGRAPGAPAPAVQLQPPRVAARRQRRLDGARPRPAPAAAKADNCLRFPCALAHGAESCRLTAQRGACQPRQWRQVSFAAPASPCRLAVHCTCRPAGGAWPAQAAVYPFKEVLCVRSPARWACWRTWRAALSATRTGTARPPRRPRAARPPRHVRPGPPRSCALDAGPHGIAARASLLVPHLRAPARASCKVPVLNERPPHLCTVSRPAGVVLTRARAAAAGRRLS